MPHPAGRRSRTAHDAHGTAQYTGTTGYLLDDDRDRRRNHVPLTEHQRAMRRTLDDGTVAWDAVAAYLRGWRLRMVAQGKEPPAVPWAPGVDNLGGGWPALAPDYTRGLGDFNPWGPLLTTREQ